MSRPVATISYYAGLILLGFVLALAVLQAGLGRGPTGVWQTSPLGAWTAAWHGEDPCWDYGDCDGYDRSGGDGGRSGGHQGYGGGGGRSGDYDGGPGDDCRNACGNTIIIPGPPGQGR